MGRRLAEAAAKVRVPKLALPAPREAGAAPPAKAAAPSLEQRLLQRATMGWSVGDQADVDEVGYYPYLSYQLDYEAIDDSPLEEALHENLPTLSMSASEVITQYEEEPEVPAFELLLATLFRSVYSPRQLYERMVVFWSDHFSIDLFSDFANFLKPIDDRDVVRRHALGTFPELLRASARSPAMLVYLTNTSNVKDHPNENYARELMELHTLGADRGYTEEDVKEVARCLTGWTVLGPDAGDRFGTFVFHREAHDFGAKTVLGRFIPGGGGERDMEIVLDLLAKHPNTAELVSEKLLRYFWGYEPKPGMVRQVAQTYLDTGGDVRAMLQLILRKAWMKTATPKLKRPYHHVVSAVRAFPSEIEEPFFLLQSLLDAGQLPFGWHPPNGYPDSEAYWAPFILPRWNFSSQFLHGGVRVDLPALDPERNPNLTRAKVRGRLNRQLTGATMSGRTKSALKQFLDAVPLNGVAVAEATGLAVASPEFQLY